MFDTYTTGIHPRIDVRDRDFRGGNSRHQSLSLSFDCGDTWEFAAVVRQVGKMLAVWNESSLTAGNVIGLPTLVEWILSYVGHCHQRRFWWHQRWKNWKVVTACWLWLEWPNPLGKIRDYYLAQSMIKSTSPKSIHWQTNLQYQTL